MVDAGDAFHGRTEEQKRKGEVVVRSMGLMGYDAWCIGESELSFGSEFLLEAAREEKLPLVCANLVYHRTGKTVGEPYIIRKYGKVKVAVVGLLDEVLVLPKPQAGYGDSLVTLDAIKTAQELIPAVRKTADVVVVLAHTGFAKSSKLARDVPGIDVIVTGHNPGVSMEARKEGGTLVMMSGSRGQYVGCLVLNVSPEEGIVSHDSKLVPLDGRIKKHELVETLAMEYNELERKLRQQKAGRQKEESLARTGSDNYLGAETCKRCHEEVFQKVAKMAHASAFHSLERSKSEGLSECLVCHTTGFGHPSGFDGPSSRVDLKGVQCEACHGMGSKHSRDGTYGKVEERNCLLCHTEERSPEFSYGAYVRKIIH
ncbi:MAG: hypothetical protein AMJ46_00495 [Latescibacteria bacterium DG_63]|nr:MAG: hypothetical protein AMJ46_00495 [Latescibacteria bacterium DG_63]